MFGDADNEESDSTYPEERRRAAAKYAPEGFRPLLIALAGPLRGHRMPLAEAELVIGRSSECDWRLNDSAASRQHARIEYVNHDSPGEMPLCYLVDMESRNGTELNGNLIRDRTALKERDRIMIGSTVIGFFVRDDAELRYDESLYESATRDTLTGLENRRQMTAYLRHHLARAERLSNPLTFLLVDLDHFKAVNDRHGHDVGDEALVHIAGILRRTCRDTDLVARWGGEEFALILPDTNLDQARTLAERIRTSVSKSELMAGSNTIHLTISVGGATYQPGDSNDSLFQRADKMRYKAKNGGRNRVEMAEDTLALE